MNLADKECLQRGYDVSYNQKENKTYCIFPDGEKCLLEEYNDGVCGSEYKIENYCIKEGDPVWDKNKCCNGLEPYIPVGVIGQSTCQPIGKNIRMSIGG